MNPSRRNILASTSAAALASTLIPHVHAAENNTIDIALVGCGGRGTGAAVNALSTTGPTRLVAMADVFPERIQSAHKSLSSKFAAKIEVPAERQFTGLDAYRSAVDALGTNGVVLLATPPAFRPLHFEYAVSKGAHVFMEKSFAVDAPGIRRVLRAGEASVSKGLKVAGGLMWHSCPGREALVQQVRDGAIGEIILAQAFRMHGPVGFSPRGSSSELAHQIRNYSNFTWLNGSFFVDWLIHDIDVCCWVKGALPVHAQGQGGRASRVEPDQLWDHFAVEYTFSDGTKLSAQGRHIDQCHNVFSNFFHGSKGSAAVWQAVSPERPRIYRNHQMTRANESWRYDGALPNAYQVEHDRLFAAIRNNTAHNEAQRCAKAAMVAIMGRMAAESGRLVSFEEALAGTVELAPNLDQLKWDGPAPVLPDGNGVYPIAVPGKTRGV